MFKKLARWILRKELDKMYYDALNLMVKNGKASFDSGYYVGKITGRAEARNKGCIVGLDREEIWKEVDDIFKDGGQFNG